MPHLRLNNTANHPIATISGVVELGEDHDHANINPSNASDGATIIRYGQPGGVSISEIKKNTSVLSRIFTYKTIPVLAILFEYTFLTTAIFSASAFYLFHNSGSSPYDLVYIISNCLLCLMFCLPCGFNREYSISRMVQWRQQLSSVFLHWNTAYLIFILVLFMSYATDFYSRGAVISQYIAGFTTAIASRFILCYLVKSGLNKKLIDGKKIIVIGDPASASFIVRRLNDSRHGINVVATIASPAFGVGSVGRQDDADRDGQKAIEAISAIARKTPIDEIIISMPVSESVRIRHFVEELGILPTTIHFAPDATAAWTHHLTAARVGQLPTLRLSRAPLTLRDRIVKRSFDILLASVLLILCLPIFFIVGALIKIDSNGPVFFRQTRHGFNQGQFRIFKFRTMTTLEDGDKFRQATRNDARITRIGGFLRRTNFDELPQLFNVLAGDMSLVGPRPHAVAHNNIFEEKIRLYAKRHNVKPGITGWSQINGYRGETDTLEKMKGRVKYDTFYIDNWSLYFDIKIMILTLLSKKAYENAY